MNVLDWQRQEATNETIFREMNEWTQDASDARADLDPLTASFFLCECSDRRCTAPISLSRVEYEAIRVHPRRFAIALHHENPEIDRVLDENPRYTTIEKVLGFPARIARSTDPRR